MKIGALFASALGIALLLPATSANAQGNVQIYGLLDAGVDITDAGKDTQTRVISGALAGNRLGFRGSEDLGNGLKTVFTLEMGFNIDEGTLAQGGRAFGRESLVGLSSAQWGTLAMGRIRTPYYMTQYAVDAFVWGHAGGLVAVTRSGPTTGQLVPLIINARSDNAINWVSPDFGGVELRAQVAAGEKSATLGHAYGASARYTKGPLDAIGTFHVQRGAGSTGGDVRAHAFGGSFDFNVARVFAGYTVEKNTCSTCTGALQRMPGVQPAGASEFRLINLGVRVPVGQFAFIAQATRISDRSDYVVSPGSRDATQLGVGVEYTLSKRTLLYGAAGTVDNKNGSLYGVASGGAQLAANSVGANNPRVKTIGVGVRHAF